MGKSIDYFLSEQSAPTYTECVLVDIDAAIAPAIVRGLSLYITPALWQTEEDWHAGYQKVAEAIERLYMPCGTEIVNNIIALRGIDPASPRHETTGVPISPPEGSTLLDLFTTLQSARGTPGEALDAIATAAEQTRDNVNTGLGLDNPEGLLLELLLAAI